MCIDEFSKYISPEKILVVSPIFLGENVWKEEYDPEFDTYSVKTAKALTTALNIAFARISCP